MAAVNYKLMLEIYIQKYNWIYFKSIATNQLDLNKDYELDGQYFSPAWYSDPLMTYFLETKLSIVEKESGLKILPTYAY